MQLTAHATARCTQRSVPLKIVEAIYRYGIEMPAPGKATQIGLNLEALRLAFEDMPELRGKLERYQNTYLVVGADEQIITVARRGTRRPHH
jgi:hypothetical protein